MHKFLFYNKFTSCLYMFRAHMFIIRRSNLHYTTSGIITPIGAIPRNSVVAENMYLLCCSVHFPPFTKQESSSLYPGGTVAGLILSQFYLIYTKVQFNIILSSLLYTEFSQILSSVLQLLLTFIRNHYALLARCIYLLSHPPNV